MSSEPPSTPEQARPAKRPRVLVACQRCKTRRQKCDNGSPACSNCARSGASCMYSDRTAYPPSYVKTLEDRVRQLEASLKSVSQHQLHSVSSAGFAASPTSTPATTTASAIDADLQMLPDEPLAGKQASRLVTGMGLLSSCAAAEPHYFGFSAGLSLAHFVQVAIDYGSTSSDVSLPLLTDRPFSNQALNADTTPAPLPSCKTGAAYIRAYLFLIHPLYPFLNRSSLWRLHNKRTRKDPGQQSSPPSTSEQQIDAALLHLVYATGSRCLQLLGNQKITKNTPEGHFLRAMQIIGDGLKFTSIRSIELTLLLAIHSMRSPSGTSVWHLSGLAVRQCIELGLHKQRAVNGQTVSVDQHKKKLFWSAYIFERKTALVLGRPFALSDEEIDLQLPMNVDDSEDEERQLLYSLNNGDTEARTNVSFHRAHIELYQLHTQIRLALYQIKRARDKNQLKNTMSSLFDQLDSWKSKVLRTFDGRSGSEQRGQDTAAESGVPSGSLGDEDSDTASNGSGFGLSRSVEVEKTELLLEFYKARRSLLQPLMTEGRSVYPFDTSDYSACADSSGQICQLYRRLHRLSPIPFSLRDLHAIFVAGFTLIYSICSCPSIYSPQRARDIGACSILLYVITEQWSSAKKYRDAFEVVAEKMEESAARFRGQSSSTSLLSSGAQAGRHRPQERPPDPPLGSSAISSEARREGHQDSTMLYSSVSDRETGVRPMVLGAVATPAETAQGSSPLEGYMASGLAAGIELDLESDIYGIEGLLYSEGLDWFTEAVL